MRTRVRRWTSLVACSALCGGLSVGLAAGTGGTAGAVGGELTVAPSSLNFGPLTLGDITGPQAFTLHNTSLTTNDTITDITTTGPAANDYFGLLGSDCATPDAQGDIELGPARPAPSTRSSFPDRSGHATPPSTSPIRPGLRGHYRSQRTGTIGYYQVSTKGTVAHFGDAGFFGDLTGTALNKPIVGIAQTGDNGGYWLAASDGGIFNYGDAGFFGSAGGIMLNKPIVGIAPTTDGKGYWLVATDGGIFNYGDAGFFGSTGSMHLNQPIVGMAASPDGGGYWLVASDGGIFSYGDAQFYGSTGSIHLNKPIVGMAVDSRRRGLLAGRLRRGHLRLRRRPVLRLDRQHPPGPAHRGHGGHARRGWLLVHGSGRRPLQLRERAVLRRLCRDRHWRCRGHGNRRCPDTAGVPRVLRSTAPRQRVGPATASAPGRCPPRGWVLSLQNVPRIRTRWPR